jgi:hypothetical protein
MLVLTMNWKAYELRAQHVSSPLSKTKERIKTPQRVDGGNSSDRGRLCTNIEQMSNYLSNGGEEEVNREAKVMPVSQFNTGCKSVFIGIPKQVLALSNSQKGPRFAGS